MEKVGGIIAYYGLEEWWFSSFSEEERIYMDDSFQPFGSPPHTLTNGQYVEISSHAPEFLNALNSWFRRPQDSKITELIHKKLIEISRERPIEKPGYFKGRHFTTWVRDVKILKKNKDYLGLENLLMNLVYATEEESEINGFGVAPYYYNELAILYRKQKKYSKEVSILERFSSQKHGPGVMSLKLFDRLIKAKTLDRTQKTTIISKGGIMTKSNPNQLIELENEIASLKNSLEQAKNNVRSWTEASASLSRSASEARAKNQGMGRGLGGAILGKSFRSAMRSSAAASNAAIAKEVAKKRAKIAEEKGRAQSLVRQIQTELTSKKEQYKTLSSLIKSENKTKINTAKTTLDSVGLLKKLKEAYELGFLTEDEYEEKRKKIVSSI